jgi:hypothetical protein
MQKTGTIERIKYFNLPFSVISKNKIAGKLIAKNIATKFGFGRLPVTGYIILSTSIILEPCKIHRRLSSAASTVKKRLKIFISTIPVLNSITTAMKTSKKPMKNKCPKFKLLCVTYLPCHIL